MLYSYMFLKFVLVRMATQDNIIESRTKAPQKGPLVYTRLTTSNDLLAKVFRLGHRVLVKE